MSVPEPTPGFWPRGADEQLVRECNCEYCTALVDLLEEFQDGTAPDGEHAALAAFMGGEADD